MVSLSREQRAEPNLAEHRLSHHLRNRRLSGFEIQTAIFSRRIHRRFRLPGSGFDC